jgi:PAS domain S-box-containing protein
MSRDDILYHDKISRIKNLLQFHPRGLTISDISQRLKLSRISASKYLDILLVSGQVEMRSFGAAKAYYLSSRVPISAMLSFSSDYILVLDADLRILQINDALLQFLEAAHSDLMGKDLSVESLSFLRSLPLRETSTGASGKPEGSTVLSTTRGGKTYHFRAKVMPTVFDNGSQGLTIILEDITEKHQARRMQAFLASIVASSDDAIIGKDLKGNIISWNKAAERIYGYTPEEVLGKSITILVPQDRKDEIPDFLERIKSGERIPRYEAIRVRKGGERIDVELSISAVRDEKGTIIAISTIARDVTEIKKMKDDLRIKKRKLQEIIEFLPDPTFILDRNRNILGWNKALEEFSGVPKEDIIGKNLLNFKPDLAKYKPLLIDILGTPEEDQKTKNTDFIRVGDTVSREVYSTKRRASLLVKAFPIYDTDGSFIGAIESVRDISEWNIIKESVKKAHRIMNEEAHELCQNLLREERDIFSKKYKGLLQTALLLGKSWDALDKKIILCDLAGTILFMSAPMARALHLSEGEDITGTCILTRTDKTSTAAFLELTGGNRQEPVVIPWYSPDGSTIEAEMQFVQVRDGNEILGCMGRIG